MLLLAGCASEGAPKPPSLKLPAAVQGLAAHRAGDGVDLSWSNPTRTTDGVSLRAKRGAGALQAEICRAESFADDRCTAITQVAVQAGGASTFHDALPVEFTRGGLRPLAYRVRVLNAMHRGAVWTEAKTVAGEAPPAVRDLQAYPVASGIAIRWQPLPDEKGSQVMLRVVRDGRENNSMLLRAGGGLADVGGTVDTGGHAGQLQSYSVFRTQTVVLHRTEYTLDSAVAKVSVAADAKLPLPAAPTAVEAVVNTLGALEVDLVWQPSTDASVSGYRVYRGEQGTGNREQIPASTAENASDVLLTGELVQGFSFADKTALEGHSYRYTVAAVNDSGERRGQGVVVVVPNP